jgi:flagellar biosynthesis/type III secretory pathway chaperone
MTPSARAHELIELSHSLVEVMAAEIETLKEGRVADIEPIQAQKVMLSSAYETHMRDVAAAPGMFNAIEPGLKADLTVAATQFEATATDNKRAVLAALELNSRLVQVIADAVTQSTPIAAGYTKTGAAPSAVPRTTPTAAPATLNRSL